MLKHSKLISKILALFLALLILITPFSALAQTYYYNVSTQTFSNSELEAIYDLRDNMIERKNNITVTFVINKVPNDISAYVNSIFKAAVSEKYANSPKSGSYIIYQTIGCKFTYSQKNLSNNKYQITLKIEIPDWATTKAQENKVDSFIEKNKTKIANIKDNDYHKIISICSYIENLVDYDYEHINDVTYYLRNTAYQALCGSHKVTCVGYAVTAYRLFKEFGIDSTIVCNDEHAWNLVKCDGKYYYADLTWEDSWHKVYNSSQWVLKGSEHYENLTKQGYNHKLSSEYLSEEFKALFPIEKGNYDPNKSIVVKLSSKSYVYDKKTKTPSVIATTANNKTIPSKYYTITYPKGRKNVGIYTVKVVFKEKYSGTYKLNFKIIPKSTSISKLTAKSKGFSVKWKKQSTQTTGYQIQYATDSKFTKNKRTVTISSNKTTSKTISNLKKKKSYYVRVRTYKAINGKKIYSNWSTIKKIQTKK